MPTLQVFARDVDPQNPRAALAPEYLVGIILAITIVLGLFVVLAIRHYRKRSRAKREDIRVAAFTPVRGVYKESSPVAEKDSLPRSPLGIQSSTFSREQLTRSIALPQKAVTAPRQTNQDIIDFHRQSGTFPKPFSFALSAPATENPSRSSWVRYSGTSSLGSSHRFSVLSSTSSVETTPTAGTPRKVRQLFTPVLPDELLLTAPGESLTVVQSFDDGWVVVGRNNGAASTQPKSLFKSSAPTGSDSVELGVVPAWCFLKPVKGLRAERPVRSSSLGITVQVNSPFASRAEILSWSNF
ncbi:hypothetical protein R3P38DRAFT_3313134 [Favolaschia claudopus]|uniref:SH3 domain-containing protein n=1 Tax=Favolaschia claudopus TaxID=2862362 RepID=A0AAW0C361_9AGAR